MPATDPADPPSALPRGTRLGEFELKRVLGAGGFGIVYLAFDHALEREVAIKEYMPVSLAGRTAAFHVSLLSQSNAENFALGLRSFVNEARLLARFDHPSLVKVHRYWEDNHTAYMAMPFYAGSSLQAVRRQLPEHPNEAWVRAILDPLLGAIERLHLEGVYHRDIAPDNVILRPDGRPVLLDFGAARRVLADRNVTLTAILKPAYAPIEQYGETGAVKQGPWTDLYALGATMHHLLLGQAPTPSTSRAVVDEMLPIASRGLPGCSTAFLECIDWMLKPRPAERPQSVAALRQALAACLPAMPVGSLAGGAPSAANWLPTMALAPAAARPSLPPVASVSSSPQAATSPPVANPPPVASGPAPPAGPRESVPIDDDATVVVPRPRWPETPMAGLPAPGLRAHLSPPSPASANPAAPGAVQPARVAAGTSHLHAEPTLSPAATLGAADAQPAWAALRTDPTLIDDDGATMLPLADSGAAEHGKRAVAAASATAGPTASAAAHPQPGHASRRAPRLVWGLASGAAAAAIALWLAWPQAGPRPLAADAGDAGRSAAGAGSSAGAVTTPPMPQAPGNPAVLAAAAPPTAPPAMTAPTNAPTSAPAAAVAVAVAKVPVLVPTTPQALPAKAQATAPIAAPAKGAGAARATAAAVAAAAAASAAAAAQAALAATPPSTDTGRPGLATSITRLPAADPSPGTHAPSASPTAPATGLSPMPGPSVNSAPGPSTTGQSPAAAAAANPQRVAVAAPPVIPAATGVTPPNAGTSTSNSNNAKPANAAKTPERDNEPVLMQARALSPSERCEGRVLVALWACVERQCKSDASLRDHPECQKLRRAP